MKINIQSQIYTFLNKKIMKKIHRIHYDTTPQQLKEKKKYADDNSISYRSLTAKEKKRRKFRFTYFISNFENLFHFYSYDFPFYISRSFLLVLLHTKKKDFFSKKNKWESYFVWK